MELNILPSISSKHDHENILFSLKILTKFVKENLKIEFKNSNYIASLTCVTYNFFISDCTILHKNHLKYLIENDFNIFFDSSNSHIYFVQLYK